METIKKLIQPGNKDVGLLFFRVSLGLLMLTHGLPKLSTLFSQETIVFASVFGMSQSVSLGLAVSAEVFCSILIILGIGTRLAAVPVAGTMAVAAFYIHSSDPFAVKEMAVLYLIGFAFIAIAGAGKYSLDYFLRNRSMRIQVEAPKTQDRANPKLT
jgi:putative oxidoreductase